MVQNESGPGDIFARFQAWFWTGNAKSGSFKDGLRCFYCTSMWFSIPVALLLTLADPQVPWYLSPILALGISAGAVFVKLAHDKLEQ